MKKKGFCFKRAVSLLLAAAMILTAAPQAGLTAFAAEPVMEGVLSEAESGESATTPIETEVGDDTAQPDDGQSETQPPEENGGQEESGDGSENGGDVSPEDPGQEENPDDTEEPGESTVPGEEQEGDGEDTADIVSEEESVSENTLGAELMEEEDASKNAKELSHGGKVEDDIDGGWEYKRLIISAFTDDGAGLSDKEIIDILASYKEGPTQRFECVQLDMQDTNSKDRKIKKEILNAAVAVLKTDAKDNEGNSRYWIDYNLSNEDGWRNFTLDKPHGCEDDIDINVTMAPIAGLGVKLKFPAVNFPAESVSANVGGPGMKDSLAANLAKDGEGDYGLFTFVSGKPAAYVSRGEDGYELGYELAGSNDSKGKDIRVGNIGSLKANTEYLMAFVADEGQLEAGGTKELKPPAGGTNATWKSYTPDIASITSINTKDGTAKLSAWDEGEALYSVTYKEGSASKTKFYRIEVGKELYKIDFLEKEITMEVGDNTYLNVVYYPSDADVDPSDLTWVMDPKDSDVIEFKKDEDGKMKGEIIAKKPGTVNVTATYQKNTEVDPQTDETPQEDLFTAACKITVEGRLDGKDVEDEVSSMNLYAVSGCDTKLDDVKFPKELQSVWKWKDPELSLAPYTGTEGHDFVAKCTKDGVSGEFTIYVRMVNTTGIVMTSLQPVEEDEEEPELAADQEAEQKLDWVDWIPDSMREKDELSLGVRFELENCEEDEWEAVQNKLLREKYAVEWSTNPKELGKQQDDGTYKYTASILKKPEKPEKKTFTVSLKDKTTKKVVYKANHTLTVITKDLFDWRIVNEKLENGNPEEEWGDDGKLTSLTFTVKMKQEEYNNNKLTFASMDTSILQLKKEATREVTEERNAVTEVTIPCAQKSTGRVWIKVTAPDEMKSFKLFSIELPDKEPKLVGSTSYTINKAATELSVPIYVSTHEQYPLVADDKGTLVTVQEIKIGGKDVKDSFELKNINELSKREAAAILERESSDNDDADSDEPYIGLYGMELSLKSATGVKAGNYTVKLACQVKGRDKDSEPEPQTVSLTVKVTDVKPKVTFKQTKKVNLFYTDDEGAGTLQINTSEEIENVKVVLADYKDKNPNKNAVCHYTVNQKTDENGNDEEGVYEIVKKNDSDGTLKKGTLEYTVKGYAGTFQTTFTVATENKAPVIVLSTKSDTLHPYTGYWDSWISMTDKATGESFELNVPQGDDQKKDEAYYAVKGKNGGKTKLSIGKFEESEEEQPAWADITGSTSKNAYKLFVTDNGNIVSRLQEIDPKNGKKADTINLELKKKNWSKPVAVSYKLQVNTATPKLTLGKATLTLNKNGEVYRGQQERTTLRLKGFNDLIQKNDWVSITGQDDKSKAEIKGKGSSLVIQYGDEDGDVIVRFNDNDIDAGTYKFKISVGKNGESEYASTVLTVKIVDKTVKQSLKVTAKGSIDMLNREDTFITYTPKLSNLTGTVEDGRLAGKDADLFEYYFEDGKLIVKANNEGRKYSTKINYEVYTVFLVKTEDWRSYEISSDQTKPFKIKVKQGKPKLNATTNGNTIYRQLDNRVDIRIEAILGKQEVEIEEVWLLNYKKDLELEGTYNPETKSVRIALCDSWGLRDVTKNGTYNVKFAVRYRDKACDVKAAEVTCPIVVR